MQRTRHRGGGVAWIFITALVRASASLSTGTWCQCRKDVNWVTHSGQKVDTSKCLAMDEWLHKVWFLHTVECYSTLLWPHGISSQNSCVEVLTPQCDGIRRWNQREVIGFRWDCEDGVPMMLFVSLPHEDPGRRWHLQPEYGLSPDARSASTLISDLPASRTMRNLCPLFEPSNLWHFVTASPTKMSLKMEGNPNTCYNTHAPWKVPC